MSQESLTRMLSIGMPTRPKPPKTTKRIHPTKDMRATINTGNDSCGRNTPRHSSKPTGRPSPEEEPPDEGERGASARYNRREGEGGEKEQWTEFQH